MGARHPESILHVDMDAFFASVEQRDDPSLQGRPVVVGGAGGRGVVAAASYEARAFGIASAMPMVRARRLCPDLVIVRGRHDHYRQVSQQVMEIFRDITPLVEPLSLDEAFLDVGGSVRLFGPPPVIGETIRCRVREQTQLPCSVGVGPTKSVAKLLSGKAKPDGLLHWPAQQVEERLRFLPIRDLWGAGPRTVERLEAFGLRTVGELAATDQRTLQRLVGDSAGVKLHQLARGHDPRKVTRKEPVRSVSSSMTFDEDIDDPEVLHRKLLKLSEKVARRLRRGGHTGRTVTLTLRFSSFETITRSRTLTNSTDRTRDIAGTASTLLANLKLERVRIRLLGVGVSNLGDGPVSEQLPMDLSEYGACETSEGFRWGSLDRVADRVAQRFDGLQVSYASLLDEEEMAAEAAEDAEDAEDR